MDLFVVGHDPMNYDEGKAYCAGFGASLAVIHDEHELSLARQEIEHAGIEKAITAAKCTSSGWTWRGTDAWEPSEFPLNTGKVTDHADCKDGEHVYSLHASKNNMLGDIGDIGGMFDLIFGGGGGDGDGGLGIFGDILNNGLGTTFGDSGMDMDSDFWGGDLDSLDSSFGGGDMASDLLGSDMDTDFVWDADNQDEEHHVLCRLEVAGNGVRIR